MDSAADVDSLVALSLQRRRPAADRVIISLSFGGIIRFSSRPAPEYNGVTDTEYINDHDDGPYGRGRFGAVPAADAEIARLPAATAGEVREKDCAVCLEEFQEGEELRMMTCPSSHGFHEACIKKWLRVSRLCPLCRFALPLEQHLVEEEMEPEPESDDETETEVEGMDAGVMDGRGQHGE